MDLMIIVGSLTAMAIGVLLITGRAHAGFRSLRATISADRQNRSVEEQKLLVEAVASWTESLRDAISGAAGIEHAIIATQNFCPEVLSPHVNQLVASLRYETLTHSLRKFASDVAHPTCDFVVVALVTAAAHQTRDLVQLLTHLSDCARAECDSYLRIWVSRARSRSAVRIISWSVGLFVSGLVVFNRNYLAPYATIGGGLVAVLIAFLFAVSLFWLHKIAEIQTPSRIFSASLAGD